MSTWELGDDGGYEWLSGQSYDRQHIIDFLYVEEYQSYIVVSALECKNSRSHLYIYLLINVSMQVMLYIGY